MKAAIYARISDDRAGDGAGTERQLADCRALCADRGWTVVAEYVDNDISAYSGKHRPAFFTMLLALANQEVETVVVWKTDRLARRGKDLQSFLDAAGQATLTSCTEPEFTGATGLLMLRIINGFAEHESGVKSERVARKMKASAEQGQPHAGGVRSFGFTPNGREIVPEEAQRLQEAAQRILAGESLSAVLTDWNREGVPTTAGGKWAPSNLSRMLRSPKVAGLREYHGALHPGTWPAILERPVWDRLRATLGQRRSVKGHRWVLTGLLVCGRCGCRMRGGANKGGNISYACRDKLLGGCGACSIMASRVEPYVIGAALAAIPNLEAEPPNDRALQLTEELAGLDADIAQLSKDHYVEKLLSRPAFLAAYESLESQSALVKRLLAETARKEARPSPQHIAGHWDTASVSWRQAVLAAVLEKVVIVPGLGTRAPVEARVTLFWRA